MYITLSSLQLIFYILLSVVKLQYINYTPRVSLCTFDNKAGFCYEIMNEQVISSPPEPVDTQFQGLYFQS